MDKINARIIAEIKNSLFVVAEVTDLSKHDDVESEQLQD